MLSLGQDRLLVLYLCYTCSMASNHTAVAQPTGSADRETRRRMAARSAVEARSFSVHGFNCSCSRCSRYDARGEQEESTARGMFIDADTGQLVQEVTF